MAKLDSCVTPHHSVHPPTHTLCDLARARFALREIEDWLQLTDRDASAHARAIGAALDEVDAWRCAARHTTPATVDNIVSEIETVEGRMVEFLAANRAANEAAGLAPVGPAAECIRKSVARLRSRLDRAAPAVIGEGWTPAEMEREVGLAILGGKTVRERVGEIRTQQAGVEEDVAALLSSDNAGAAQVPHEWEPGADFCRRCRGLKFQVWSTWCKPVADRPSEEPTACIAPMTAAEADNRSRVQRNWLPGTRVKIVEGIKKGREAVVVGWDAENPWLMRVVLAGMSRVVRFDWCEIADDQRSDSDSSCQSGDFEACVDWLKTWLADSPGASLAASDIEEIAEFVVDRLDDERHDAIDACVSFLRGRGNRFDSNAADMLETEFTSDSGNHEKGKAT